ncbi:hypothetical protein KGQ19_47045 [Catenulispora sp. NL8]|uniref:Uncharacterized protein n=1 Tax=Catenulispora pinistramenti TaxID=2705254 RepID=A0ABS5L7Y2_9ACTN|nr:hypothetical protein [Catenulispora pinistramenti]MBS2554437.1 hypothetical protein [Catenulispora pinistramenti]
MSRDSDTITLLWLLAAIGVVAYRRHIAYWLGIGMVMLLLTSLLLDSHH